MCNPQWLICKINKEIHSQAVEQVPAFVYREQKDIQFQKQYFAVDKPHGSFRVSDFNQYKTERNKKMNPHEQKKLEEMERSSILFGYQKHKCHLKLAEIAQEIYDKLGIGVFKQYAIEGMQSSRNREDTCTQQS